MRRLSDDKAKDSGLEEAAFASVARVGLDDPSVRSTESLHGANGRRGEVGYAPPETAPETARERRERRRREKREAKERRRAEARGEAEDVESSAGNAQEVEDDVALEDIFGIDESKTISANPFLSAVRPKDGYIFHSDYFKVDTYYATVLSYFHTQGATDNFGPFWGVNRIPSGLKSEGVTTVNLEQVKRMGERWVREHQDRAEGVAEMNDTQQRIGGTNSSNVRSSRARQDLATIATEMNDGASYLSVCDRLLVKAPSLEVLDEAVDRISRLYMDRFGTMHAAPYAGAQREELSRAFFPNAMKRGKPFYYTSTEYAGSYSLVTHGMEDPAGEYVGYMVGDVNTSAVVMDVDAFAHHVVVATPAILQRPDPKGEFAPYRARLSDMWASKLSQAALLDGKRVVHVILNGCEMDRLGPALAKSTARVDMSHGDLNMFEMFGEVEDELSIFASQMRKLELMAEQAYETTEHDRSIIRASLQKVATDFYIDARMWRENAKAARDKLRVVGIPHSQVPRLETFVSYLDMEYQSMVSATARDDERLHALGVLSATFRNLLSTNGDLFNTVTADAVDGARGRRRVIYDFGSLMRRGHGVAMAQLVNVIGFAVSNLSLGDLVIFHGAQLIDPRVREYVSEQLGGYLDGGGRVAWCYDSVEAMLDDAAFNRFDAADWTCLGTMTERVMARYQDMLGQRIPADLAKLVCGKATDLCYVRRGFSNVVFRQDLLLDGGLKFRGKVERGLAAKRTGWRERVKRSLRRRSS